MKLDQYKVPETSAKDEKFGRNLSYLLLMMEYMMFSNLPMRTGT